VNKHIQTLNRVNLNLNLKISHDYQPAFVDLDAVDVLDVSVYAM